MPFKPLGVAVEDAQPRRHVDYQGVNRRAGADSKTAEFIAWDGEGIKMAPTPLHHPSGLWIRNGVLHEDDGSLITFTPEPQPYVLLANSKGERIIADNPRKGLSTYQCFKFLLDEKEKYPNSIFVGYGFNYDVNQMLGSWPDRWLKGLYQDNQVKAGNYIVKWFPRKFFNITQFKPRRRSVIVYDTIGFFQSSFLEACRKYLGSSDLALIERGKESRSVFEWEQLEDFIIPYNDMELSMLVRVMDILRKDLAKAGVYPSQWYGPGAVAQKVMSKYKVPIAREFPTVVPNGVVPRIKGVNHAAQFAMAGGRFEHYWLGHFPDTVYEADIHSAYPAAATQLPDLSQGYWEHVQRFEPGSFGIWYIDYLAPFTARRGYVPQPLFCRAEHGNISYPLQTQGWYWTPEAELCADSVQEGFVFRERNPRRPFDFIPAMYRDRLERKEAGDSVERAIKLILNSLYGKTAQTVGGKDNKPPRWHQLEYAGYITSSCRAKVYRAMTLAPETVIAAETDAVFSTKPLPLPYSDELGDWELKEYSSIVYLQNGFYYAVTDEEPDEDTPIEAVSYDGTKIKCRFRGLDTDRKTQQPIGLPYRYVLDQLSHVIQPLARKTPALDSTSRRFNGLGLKIRTGATWRAWEDVPKAVSLDGNRSSKRVHVRTHCPICLDGYSLADRMHPLAIGGYEGKSHARKLPWIDEPLELEMDDTERQWTWDIERFQP